MSEPANTRYGRARIKNSWGEQLYQLTLRHRRGNDVDKQEELSWLAVSAGVVVGPLDFVYETGTGSPFDYWWVKLVTLSGQVWQCKSNFYCSVAAEDDGNVTLAVDGASHEMTVDFNKSIGCYVALTRGA